MLTHLCKINRMALDFLFPPKCTNCGREGEYVCNECLHMAVGIKPPVCPICMLPVAGSRNCDCRFWQSLDRLSAPYAFQGTIRSAIIQFKFHNLRAIAPFLARLLQRHLVSHPIAFEAIVPVPLHKKRLRERGYNQSFLLAKELSRLTETSLESALIRNHHTLSQVDSANASQRRKNVNKAFTCNNLAVKGKKVLLIDDVATTGATLDACAHALKQTGTSLVQALVLAREI